MSLPILFILFNRPDPSRAVFEAIRAYKPARLYVAADGPRSAKTHPTDHKLCESTRAIVETIDWPCKVQTRYLSANLGCGNAVSQAITWFFSIEKRGVVLEDDCLPSPHFFVWQEMMLERFRDHSDILHVNGTNFLAPKSIFGGDNYRFSSFPNVWGWGSWSRAWNLYEKSPDIASVPPVQRFQAPGISRRQAAEHRSHILAAVSGAIDTWDYQWSLTNFKNRSLVPTPSANLITNIGHGAGATHTHDSTSSLAALPLQTFEANDSFRSAPELKVDAALNRFFSKSNYGSPIGLSVTAWRNAFGRFRRRWFNFSTVA